MYQPEEEWGEPRATEVPGLPPARTLLDRLDLLESTLPLHQAGINGLAEWIMEVAGDVRALETALQEEKALREAQGAALHDLALNG